MTRTFLVAVDLAGSEDLTMVAAEIEDSLLTDGITVTSVRPWASAITELETDSGFQMPTLPSSSLASR